MSDDQRSRNQRVIGLALLAGAGLLAILALLFYTGAFPLPADTRPLAATVVGACAVADALIGLMFLQRSQSR